MIGQKDIYKIEEAGRPIYVGQANDFNLRFNTHKRGRQTIDVYMREKGIKNFTVVFLERTVDFNEREKFWIKELRTHKSQGGFNQDWGGGGRNYGSILTLPDVVEITELLSEGVFTQEEIANLYSVAPTTIGDINAGRSWRREEVAYPIRDQEISKNFTYTSTSIENRKQTNLQNLGVDNPMKDKQIRNQNLLNRYRNSGQCGGVVNLETGKVFISQQDAAEWAGLKYARNIIAHLNGTRQSAGKVPETKQKATWRYAQLSELEQF